MNESTDKEVYKRLCEYQSYLRHDLLKTAAESTNSARYNDICKDIEANTDLWLENLESSLIPLLQDYPNLRNSCLKAVLPLAISTSELHAATKKYVESCFSEGSGSVAESHNLIFAQQRLFSAKMEYEAATGRHTGDNFASLLKEFAFCQAKEKEEIIAKMYSELSDMGSGVFGGERGQILNNVVQSDRLPEFIDIGTFQELDKITCDRLINSDIRDIIEECGRRSLSVNIRGNGNIVINAPADSRSDDALYGFICNIVLKYYDLFPLGALHVHFVDSLKDPRFSKFLIGFQNGNTNEKTRAAAELVQKYDSLTDKTENRCRDLMENKFVGDTRDIYDLFRIDDNEYLDLVVIRNGFSDIVKNGGSGLLRDLVNHFAPKSRGHRCGLRFIVVNDVDTDSLILDEDAKRNIRDMSSYAEFVLDYANGIVKCGNRMVNPLSVEQGWDEERFIESKCSKIGNALAGKAGKPISYEELGCFGGQTAALTEIVEIPVGKSGNEIITIPFSCADTENSDAAKNIGLMVLGQSGSGKSSLYHSIIINGSMKYSPEDLQFWLLDFKNNSSAGIYLSAKNDIPHIKIVAPNSKKNDAYNILGILNEEMQSRLDRFNKVGNLYGVKLSNVLEYNRFIEEKAIDVPHLPRIILMIDEAQELFRDAMDGTNDELSRQIGNYISRIVSLGRSSGVHMAMFAQNLDSQKTYILKDNFINQLKCKACFRLSSSSVVNSGFKGEFDTRKDEIESLGTGEIYLSYSNTEITKCRVAYASGSELIGYLGDIAKKYSSSRAEVLKIGVTSQLSVSERIPRSDKTYLDRILDAHKEKGKLICPIGEDAYSLKPVNLIFETGQISSCFLVGNSRGIATSVFASLLMGLSRVGSDLRVCNGTLKEENLYNELINSGAVPITKHSLFNIDECVGKVYIEYKKRKAAEEKDSEYDSRPIVLFLNDFDAQDKIKQNAEIKLDDASARSPVREAKGLADIFAIEQEKAGVSAQSQEEDYLNGVRLRDAIGELLKSAYQYNIYLVVLLKETWYREFDEALKASCNVIIFNETDYQSVADNYLIKDLLKDIRQNSPARSIDDFGEDDDTETDNESFAILFRKKKYHKFRPVIYHGNNADEKNMIIKTLENS